MRRLGHKRGVDPAELFRAFASPATIAPVTATLSQSAVPESAPLSQSPAAPATETVALDVLRTQLAAAEREAWLRSLLDAERTARHHLEQHLLPAPRRAFAKRLADTLAALRRAWRGER